MKLSEMAERKIEILLARLDSYRASTSVPVDPQVVKNFHDKIDSMEKFRQAALLRERAGLPPSPGTQAARPCRQRET
jgi:hypothetical protein